MLKMSLKILSLPTIPYFPIIPTISYLFFEISLLGSGLCVDLTVRNSIIGSKKANKTSMKIDTFFRIREELLYFTSPPPEVLCIVVFHTGHIVWEENVYSYTLLHKKGKLKVSSRERPSLYCIMTMITQRTIIGFQIKLAIHLPLSLSMNSGESKHRTCTHL